MQDPTHRAGRKMMHWGLWPARGELGAEPGEGGQGHGRVTQLAPAECESHLGLYVAPSWASNPLNSGLWPQPPNSIFFILSNTIGSELRGPFFTVKLLTCQGSILYSQTFGPPHGSTSL